MSYSPVPDTELPAPQFLILRASAGSGKTYELTRRFVQLYLSEHVPRTSLANIIAITFSNNAANEMKERILEWLKGAALKEDWAIKGLTEVLRMKPDEITKRANEKIEELIDHYQELQVRTIDSLMTGLFRATAIEQGLSDVFEVSFDKDRVFEYAFDLFLRKATDAEELKEQIYHAVDLISEAAGAYPWNPADRLLTHFKGLFEKVSSLGLAPAEVACLEGVDPELVDRVCEAICALHEFAKNSGLQLKANVTWWDRVLKAAQDRDITTVVKSFRESVPFKKGESYQEALERFQEIKDLVREVTFQWAGSYWFPYVEAYRAVEETLEEVKRSEAIVFLEDIGLKLGQYISQHQVADLYFFLGEVLHHWLIDEFQDTSPVQWQVIRPLIENALAEGGTFMLVGDIKQAIYGYRNADFRIMKALQESSHALPVEADVQTLQTNRRSSPEIVEFSKRVFEQLQETEEPKLDLYREAAREVGLNRIEQQAHKDNPRGYVETLSLEQEQLSRTVPELIKDLTERGFTYSDIAILAPKNEHILEAVSILNQHGIPVFSFSSLDARRTKTVKELIGLLRFLDEPVNDMAFGEFLLGEVFHRATGIHRQEIESLIFEAKTSERPLYKAFQERFPDRWDELFSSAYKLVGYLPLYDLLVHIYEVFGLLERFPEEEAALVKVLEVALEAETMGISSAGEFIDTMVFAPAEAGLWDIKPTASVDAVQAMTIHKSKGLGFRVVILLMYPGSRRAGGRDNHRQYYLASDNSGVFIYKITSDLSQRHDSLKRLYEETSFLEAANDLNLLYVGLTRAEEQLYVLKIYKQEKHLKEFPLSVVPEVPAPAGGRPPRQGLKEKKKVRQILPELIPSVSPTETEDQQIQYMERKRGEEMHALLAEVKYLQDLDKLHEHVSLVYASEEDLERLKHCVNNFREYFEQRPSREVFTEIELVAPDGRTVRVDRLVVDPDVVTVVEFKTGSPAEAHQSQLRRYLSVVRTLYPDRSIQGCLLYLDTGQEQVIEIS